jgi:hypothetical protein
MFSETMDIYVYDDYLKDYDEPFTAENPVYKAFTPKRLTRQEQMERAMKNLVGVEIKENNVFIEEKSDKQVKQAQMVFESLKKIG